VTVLSWTDDEASARAVAHRGRAFLDGAPCAAPDDIVLLVAPMLADVERRVAVDGVLFGAGLLYGWIVSVHPFSDANGRTARLGVDPLLGLHGSRRASSPRSISWPARPDPHPGVRPVAPSPSLIAFSRSLPSSFSVAAMRTRTRSVVSRRVGA
jgi:hypothetical protein